MKSNAPQTDDQAALVREFNRFYVRQIGLLEGGLLKGSYSLTQMHVLYELAQHNDQTASSIGQNLGLDKGYLSRILKKFTARGLITKSPSKSDARQSILKMTAKGRSEFKPLDELSHRRTVDMLAPLTSSMRKKTISAMQTIHSAFNDVQKTEEPDIFREIQSGDLGWLVHRHGIIYNKEYGWDTSFEAMVANILCNYLVSKNTTRERAWIVQRKDQIIGSIFCMYETDEVANLRVFYVEPSARGEGVGGQLVAKCIKFARTQGYRKISLLTNDALISARKIYQAADFKLRSKTPVQKFGKSLIEEEWELVL